MLCRLWWMLLTAFGDCLSTCPASAYIVARNPDSSRSGLSAPHSRQTDRQTHRTCTGREWDAAAAAAAADATWSAAPVTARYLPGGHWHVDVDQVLMEHVLTSTSTASQLSHTVHTVSAADGQWDIYSGIFLHWLTPLQRKNLTNSISNPNPDPNANPNLDHELTSLAGLLGDVRSPLLDLRHGRCRVLWL